MEKDKKMGGLGSMTTSSS